jgi:dihydrofolate reductase
MQAPGGPEEDPTGGFDHGGWTFPYWDEVMGEAMGESFGRPFELLLGRKTWEIFAAHWPYTSEEPAGLFNNVTKYVATSSAAPLAWANSVRLEGDVPAAVARLKQGDGPDLLTQGSSVLVQSLLAAGLVDELNLLVFPVLLGRGKKLFGDSSKPGELELVSSRTSTTGVIIAKYRPSGPVRTGSFQLSEPSEAEMARREKMKREG